MKPTDPRNDHPHHHTPEELHNEGVAHEESDVNIRAIIGFGAIVVAMSVVCAVIVWGVFDVLANQANARDPKLSPLAMPAAKMPAPTSESPFFGSALQPQIVVSEPTVLGQFRQREDKTLHQYGWVNERAGIAQLPIDQAKKLILERGLPARAGATDPTLGTHAPAFGEATGGRSIPTGEPAAIRPPDPQPPAPAAAPAPKEQPAHPPTGRGGGA